MQAPVFSICSSKSHEYPNKAESKAMWAVCISRFQCSAMPTVTAEICRSSWTDKTTSYTIPMTKLKDTNKKFSG